MSEATILSRVETHPNENCRTYHVRRRLTLKGFNSWLSPAEAIEKDAPIYVRRIYSIDGVVSVSIDQYCIGVVKSAAFSWDEIESRITAIIDLEIPNAF